MKIKFIYFFLFFFLIFVIPYVFDNYVWVVLCAFQIVNRSFKLVLNRLFSIESPAVGKREWVRCSFISPRRLEKDSPGKDACKKRRHDECSDHWVSNRFVRVLLFEGPPAVNYISIGSGSQCVLSHFSCDPTRHGHLWIQTLNAFRELLYSILLWIRFLEIVDFVEFKQTTDGIQRLRYWKRTTDKFSKSVLPYYYTFVIFYNE